MPRLLTTDDKDFIRQNRGKMSAAEIARRLGRDGRTIRTAISKLDAEPNELPSAPPSAPPGERPDCESSEEPYVLRLQTRLDEIDKLPYPERQFAIWRELAAIRQRIRKVEREEHNAAAAMRIAEQYRDEAKADLNEVLRQQVWWENYFVRTGRTRDGVLCDVDVPVDSLPSNDESRDPAAREA